MRPLTLKQERACQEFIKTGNKSAAYRIAYDCSKMKEASVNRLAHQFFLSIKIKSRVAELMAPVAKRAQISVDRVLTEAARLAFSDPRKFVDASGRLKAIEDLDDDSAAALAQFEISEGEIETGEQGQTILTRRIKKVKLWDKNAALDRLAKILRMFGDAPIADAPGTVTIRVSGADQVVLGISAAPARIERIINGD